jgi:hypothetical protein
MNNKVTKWLRKGVGGWVLAGLISCARAEVCSYTVGIDMNCPAGLGE